MMLLKDSYTRFRLPSLASGTLRWTLVAHFFLIFGVGFSCAIAADEPRAITPAPPTNSAKLVEIPGIQNAFHVSDQIYSGSQPEGDAAFAALAKLGIHTLISVDGSKPDVARAHKFGLHYVHLPYGYDGVPANRVAELARIAASTNGPFFVHCHHGKHRGPSAVAVMCLAQGLMTRDTALAWMHQAGTAPDYPGLFRAASEFTMPTVAQLAAVAAPPEVAPTTSLVDAMVTLDSYCDTLKQCQTAGWKSPRGQPDVTPAHQVTLVWEQLREIARLGEVAHKPAAFRSKLATSEKLASILRASLAQSASPEFLDANFKNFTLNCAACHKDYRN